jgi:hypothetical protein
VFHIPCRSGLPSGVRDGVHGFAADVAFAGAAFAGGEVACPAAGGCAIRRAAIMATEAVAEARERRVIAASFPV